ncbi:MAG TPA: hypothetical protein VFB99_09770, partial [Vicinamibacterales bacterium]|nr:hypothetical protein [Vicinamibacterales bacterium]
MRVLAIALAGLSTLAAGWMMIRDPGSGIRSPGTFPSRSTSRAELEATIESDRQKVSKNPGDGAAAVQLADALMRAARVNGDASLAIEAEHVLRATLQHSSSDYLARRMLSVVYLSQHRFAEALTEAKAAQKLRPRDAWNYAIAGDALLELGRYEEAFDS